MSARRMRTLLVLGVTLTVIGSGCAGSLAPEAEPSGCRQDIAGVPGVIQTETSKLNCTAINELISAVPSEPQAYSIMSESTHLLWNCRLYAPKGHAVLLRCTHNTQHFSIRKQGG